MNTDEVRTYRPHRTGKINQIEVLGSIVFTASYDGTIMATELVSGMTIRSFIGHRHSVTTIVVINIANSIMENIMESPELMNYRVG